MRTHQYTNEKPAAVEQRLPAIYDTHDLAQHFRVTPDAINIWANKGALPPPLPLPGRRRWSGPAIERFLVGEVA